MSRSKEYLATAHRVYVIVDLVGIKVCAQCHAYCCGQSR